MDERDEAFNNAREVIKDFKKSLDKLLEDINSQDDKRETRALLVLLTLDLFITERTGLSFWAEQIKQSMLEGKFNFKNLH